MRVLRNLPACQGLADPALSKTTHIKCDRGIDLLKTVRSIMAQIPRN